jgi:hypothetical protein
LLARKVAKKIGLVLQDTSRPGLIIFEKMIQRSHDRVSTQIVEQQIKGLIQAVTRVKERPAFRG